MLKAERERVRREKGLWVKSIILKIHFLSITTHSWELSKRSFISEIKNSIFIHRQCQPFFYISLTRSYSCCCYHCWHWWMEVQLQGVKKIYETWDGKRETFFTTVWIILKISSRNWIFKNHRMPHVSHSLNIY